MFRRRIPDKFHEDEYAELDEMSDRQLEYLREHSGEDYRKSRISDVLTSRTRRTRKSENS
jgi:hypothetical protein